MGRQSTATSKTRRLPRKYSRSWASTPAAGFASPTSSRPSRFAIAARMCGESVNAVATRPSAVTAASTSPSSVGTLPNATPPGGTGLDGIGLDGTGLEDVGLDDIGLDGAVSAGTAAPVATL